MVTKLFSALGTYCFPSSVMHNWSLEAEIQAGTLSLYFFSLGMPLTFTVYRSLPYKTRKSASRFLCLPGCSVKKRRNSSLPSPS